MTGFGYVCALVLAAVLVRAGTAKIARPATTVAGFEALGVPGAGAVARVVPVVELTLAAALVAAPRAGAVGALLMLGAFTAFLARAVRAGVTAGCNCFGDARAEPVSSLDLARNGLLALLAFGALAPSGPTAPTVASLVVAGAAVGAGAGALRAARARSLPPRSWRGPGGRARRRR